MLGCHVTRRWWRLSCVVKATRRHDPRSDLETQRTRAVNTTSGRDVVQRCAYSCDFKHAYPHTHTHTHTHIVRSRSSQTHAHTCYTHTCMRNHTHAQPHTRTHTQSTNPLRSVSVHYIHTQRHTLKLPNTYTHTHQLRTNMFPHPHAKRKCAPYPTFPPNPQRIRNTDVLHSVIPKLP